MTTFFYCILSASSAAILTLLLCKAFFSKSAITPAAFGKLQGELLAGSSSLATAIAERAAMAENLDDTRQRLSMAQQQLEDAQQAARTAEKTATQFEEEVKHKAQLLTAQKEFVENIKGEMERQFRIIAGTSLDENSQKLNMQQQEKLQSTLQPFREQIEAFRKQVDEKFTAEVADRNTLKGELSKVFALTNSLTDQANKLTNALTTHTKTQGNFGEDILEATLTNAGMLPGVHYEKQYNTINEDGRRIIPDIILHCPGGYSLVVDSKVSLTHYLRYCNEVLNPEQEKGLRREIWQSFKNHIDGLSSKKYERIDRCADFVLLFAPVESAFTVAAQHDNDIRNYAFQKKVFLVTPSNLLLVVRLISDLWQKDRVNKDAQAMADRAGALYEKACGFLESFAAAGASLDRAKSEWSTAATRLTGNGGLVRQGEMLQELLGSKTSKMIPASLAAEAALAEGITLPVKS